ncbi:SusC/RagA family TonB-linked outer membrane protein [Fulvivirga sp. M361]|uniref:SusC/RagA family TonB-linked outer membrane protein n=1 Tax=Fulvivirga sp. M361 TaxID=2594266 RepID=UPI00117A762C|nr:SusC/RagA family TonB-linked outer membrane protein [Fulvivirga sp. M361]TRX60756.1 SusC/RagA family TonB-linked outer membrane protein [Fulvivirga sp. M361]
MKHFYFAIFAFSLSLSAFAQDMTVTGRVVDESTKEPLPGANVLLKNSSTGVVTNVDGGFTINAPADGVLVISFIGFVTQEVPVRNRSNIDIALSTDVVGLSEIVVTAFGLEKESNKLGYSVQNLNTEELARASDPNLGSALRGKLSGVNINSNSGGIGSSVSINVRGISSLGINNQPLIVLDGVLIDNNQGNQADFAEGLDYGNTLSNLNPNDIESISLLKGGNATALYGFRGNNGVLVINTKSGRTERVSVEVNSAITASSILVSPEFQNSYGQGFFDTGTGELTYDITRGSSYGPLMDGSDRERFDGNGTAAYGSIGDDQFRDFFQTGVSFLNSVSISQARGKFNYRVSYSRSDDESIIPGSQLERQNFSIKAGAEVTDWLNITGKVDYIDQKAENRPELTDGQSNITRALSLRPRNVSNDLLSTNAFTSEGAPNNWSGAFITNPYYTVNTFLNEDQTDRYISLFEFRADLTKGLNALGRLSQDYIVIEQDIFNPLGAFDIARNGRYINVNSTSRTNNYDLILSYDKVISSAFDISANLGFSHTRASFKSLRATGETFLVPNFFSLLNFETTQLLPESAESSSNSIFGAVTLGLNQYLFAEFTARNDWSSTLPINNASFFYPSAGLSFVLSEAIPGMKNGNAVSLIKLRGSIAQTGNATTPFSLINTYNTSSGLFNGQRFFFFGDNEEGAGLGPILKNPNLEPEISDTYEFGIDARFLDNRISVNATYYNIRTSNQILNLTLPPASGAASQVINAGLITNKGVEITLTADVVKTGDFNWTSTLNYTTNDNVVKELSNGVERNILVRQFNDIVQVAAEVGSSPQALYGSKFERNIFGQILYDTDGLPMVSDEIGKIGDAAPDAFANWSNTFTYKQFSVSFLLDARFGGDLFSFSDIERHAQGTAIETLAGREFYSGGQGILVPEDAVIFKNGELSPTILERGVDPQTYWGRLGTISENWVIDGSFVKFRELTVGYSFPESITSKLSLTNLSINYVGRNLAILHSNTDNFDPETGFNNSFSGVEYFGIPTAKSHGLRLNITF